jgi:hypothetical protein
MPQVARTASRAAAGDVDNARPTAWTANALAAAVCVGAIALAFASGGYFAGATGAAEAAAAAALAVWGLVAPRPLAAWTAPLGIAVIALGAFALWTLLSSHWSHAPARAAIEADRALLYALVVALVGLIGAVPAARRIVQTGLIGALVIAVVCGLITRLLPDVWPISPEMEFERLSYPVGYWNAMAAIGALAAIGCIHLTADTTRHRALRSAAAAALPLVTAGVLLTFSRGGIGVMLAGIAAYLLLARSSGAIAALAAPLPTTAVAAAFLLRADGVVDATQAGRIDTNAGAMVALVLAGSAVAAGVAMWLLHRWEPRPTQRRPRATRAVVAVVVVVTIAAAIGSGAVAAVVDRAGDLPRSSHVRGAGDGRARLTQLSDNGRIDAWRVSVGVFADHPLTGSGAGTFALSWVHDRPNIRELSDGHSLLFESLGELGIIGTALLILAIGGLAWGVARGLRSPQRPAAALGLAVLGAWTVHACIDWDWEMPALTLPALAMAAVVAGGRRPPYGVRRTTASWFPRGVAVTALVCLGLVGVGLAVSQRDVDTAVAAVHDGRCETAETAARSALGLDGQRPEAYQVLAVCAARAGDPTTALDQMRQALALDPDNWRLVYDVAVLQGLQGRDPRPTLRAARRLNPRSWFLRIAARPFNGNTPQVWQAAARQADLLV